jgi:hypothetical protein
LDHIPLLVLLSVPKNLSPRWQAVYNALALPVALVRSLLRDQDPAGLSLGVLFAQLELLRRAREGIDRTVDELDAVAPRTWKAGYAIRAAFLPVWAILEGGLFTMKAKAGSLVWQPVPAPDWPQVAPHVLERLVKRRDGLDEESLLMELRDAVVAEKDIDLQGPTSTPVIEVGAEPTPEPAGALAQGQVTRPSIWQVSGKAYRVGNSEPYSVSDREDAILQAFARHPAMTDQQLQERSGYPDAAKLLRALITKYGGVFAPAIRIPGKKAAGGYYAEVRLLPKGNVAL